MRKSILLSSSAQLLNIAFPILTTPLVARISGADTYADVALVALIGYVLSAIIDAGVGTFAVTRWGSRSLPASLVTRLFQNVVTAQAALGVIGGVAVLAISSLWLDMSAALIAIAVVSGFSPVIFPSWFYLIRGDGGRSLAAVLVGRVVSLVLLVLIAVRGGAPSAITVSLCWILVPVATPVLFFPAGAVNTGSRRGLSLRFIRKLFHELLAGISVRISVAIYGSLLSILLGRFAPKSDVASYMLLDRFRVIGQTLVSSQFPGLAVLMRSPRRGSVVLLAALISVAYFVGFVALFPFLVSLFPSSAGWTFSGSLVGALAAMGAVVTFSNTLIYMLYVPLWGQSSLARLLRCVVVGALVCVPASYFTFGLSGAVVSVVLIESLLATAVLVKIHRVKSL